MRTSRPSSSLFGAAMSIVPTTPRLFTRENTTGTTSLVWTWILCITRRWVTPIRVIWTRGWGRHPPLMSGSLSFSTNVVKCHAQVAVLRYLGHWSGFSWQPRGLGADIAGWLGGYSPMMVGWLIPSLLVSKRSQSSSLCCYVQALATKVDIPPFSGVYSLSLQFRVPFSLWRGGALPVCIHFGLSSCNGLLLTLSKLTNRIFNGLSLFLS